MIHLIHCILGINLSAFQFMPATHHYICLPPSTAFTESLHGYCTIPSIIGRAGIQQLIPRLSIFTLGHGGPTHSFHLEEK